ncbi:hypothetical protein, partial [Butyrivibrio sp. WCE2006]|uniref:hypothetical protein n=1 Tax=Butyrivibrio sp. WCE2006 TaxID=1410611 RepID=UPI003FA44F8F
MKKNKRIWSWALTGALAVSNLSAVAIPITALAASYAEGWTIEDESTADSATYVGEKYDVTYSKSDFTDEDNGKYLGLYAKVGTAGYSFLASSEAIANGAAVVTTTPDQGHELTASESGNITYAVFIGDAVENNTPFSAEYTPTGNPLATKEVTITGLKLGDWEITAEKDVEFIPSNAMNKSEAWTVKGNGAEGLDLTLKVTANYETAFPAEVDWFIENDKGIPVGENAFVLKEFAPSTSATTFTERATIVVKDHNDTAAAGAYTVLAWADKDEDDTYDEGEEVATYPFTVVGIADGTTFSVLDEDGNNETAAENKKYVNDTIQLTMYNNKDGSPVSAAKYSLFSKDEDTISVTEDGLVTGLKVTDGAFVNASYPLNNDLELLFEKPYKAVISEDPAPVADEYYAFIVDDNGEVVEDAVNLEAGETANVAMYVSEGGERPKPYTGKVEWTSGNTNYATVDANGVITAMKVTGDKDNVKITGTVKSVGASAFTTVNIKAMSYVFKADDNKIGATFNGVEEKSYAFSVAKSTGEPIEGTVEWNSSNPQVAKVDADGVVTIKENAASLTTKTTDITAMVGKTLLGKVTVTAVKSAETYKAEVEDAEHTKTYNEVDVPALYYGETANLAAYVTDEFGNDTPVTGIWATDSEAIKISGDSVEVAAEVEQDSVAPIVIKFWKDAESKTEKPDEPDATTKVAVLKDVYALTIDGSESGTLNETTWTADAFNMEVGETRDFVVMKGSQDITDQMTWSVDDEASKKFVKFTTSKAGRLEAISEGINAKVTGKYPKTGEAKLTVKATIKQILPETGALDLAKEAITESGNAIEASDKAEDAAIEAKAAAEAVKETPTQAKLDEAKAALDDAKSNLDNALDALEAAQAAYEAAVKAGAKSTEAKAAVDAAKDAVEAAQKAYDDAKEVVDEAEAAYKDAKDIVDNKTKEELIAAAEKAADAAVANPTEANIKAAKDAVAAAEAAGATEEGLADISAKIDAAVAAKQAADDAAAKEAAKQAAIEDANAAADAAKADPTADKIQAAKDAIAAA